MKAQPNVVFDIYHPNTDPHDPQSDRIDDLYVADILIREGDGLWHIGELTRGFSTPQSAEDACKAWLRSPMGREALKKHQVEEHAPL